jgi:hypothetical protein
MGLVRDAARFVLAISFFLILWSFMTPWFRNIMPEPVSISALGLPAFPTPVNVIAGFRAGTIMLALAAFALKFDLASRVR